MPHSAQARSTQSRFTRRQPTPLALALMMLALPAVAETTLPTITVDAEAPVTDNVVTIEADTMRREAARDMREILQNEVGLSVGGGGNAITQKLYIRGIEDTMLYTTLDGAPQGGNLYHHQARIVIDPTLLKSVEIDKGSSAASAGPGALAGSIRLTTKDASDLLRPGQHVGAIIDAGIASNDGKRYGATLYGRAGKQFDLLVSGNRNDTDDYESGNGETQNNTASELTTGLVKTTFRPADGHAFSLGYTDIHEEATRYLRSQFRFAFGGLPMPQSFDRETLTGSYRYDGGDGVPSVDLSLFSDDNIYTRTNASANLGKPAGYRFGEQVEARGANLLLISKLGSTALRYGANYHRFDARAINPTGTGALNQGLLNTSKEEADVKGVFAEASVPLGDRVLLGAGVRYDWYSLTDNHGQNFDTGGASPGVNLTWAATDALTLRATASRALRGAGIKETLLIDNGPGPHRYVNDPSMKEEVATNLEAGFHWAANGFKVFGAAYKLTIDDFINTVFAPPVVTRTNVGTVESPGYELGAGWQVGNFRIDASVTHSKPELNGVQLIDSDFALGLATGRTWTLGAGWTLPQRHLDFTWNTRFVEEHDSLDPADGVTPATKPGYGVHDLYVNWQPPGQNGLRVTFSVKNAFDKQYFDQATYGFNGSTQYGYAEPGRDIRLDLSWKL